MPLRRTPLAALVLTLTLTGCSGVNGGAATVAEFDDWLEEHPFTGMQVVATSTAETLPWAGTADITVSVAAGDIASAAEHVCGFEPRHGNTAALTVEASGVGVPVDCADPAATAATWAVLSDLDGLREVTIDTYELQAVFADGGDALAAWDALRDVPSSRYVLEVAGGWTLTDQPETTDAARGAARDALSSIYIVDRVEVTPDTPARPEHVTVEVAFDAPLLRRDLMAGHPERADLVTVSETPRIPPQVRSSASSLRRTTSSPTSPSTSR